MLAYNKLDMLNFVSVQMIFPHKTGPSTREYVFLAGDAPGLGPGLCELPASCEPIHSGQLLG